ncbi:MAG: RIP metalloprotease RseP [Alistipes sp.]|nr:RIP metalloprotease RseP [Alistipes sp.]
MEAILIKALQFFASLSLLVMIHEFGHYITARIFKIRVEKFYIFFNPWFSLYKRKIGETEYGIGWLPLGGYVSLAGMIDESMDLEQMKQEPQPWEFRTKPAWQRLIVMLAGITMNVLLAMAIYSGMLYTWGENYFHNDDMVYGYSFNEAGEKLGFVDGDKIVSIDGEAIGNIREIDKKLIIADDNRTVVVERGGENVTLTLPLEQLVAMREDQSIIGFYEPIVPFIIESVESDSSKEAGVMAGDKVITIDNNAISDFFAGKELLAKAQGRNAEIDIVRNAADTLRLSVPINAEGKMGVSIKMIAPRTVEYGFFESIPAGIRRTGREIASYWDQLKMIVNPKTKSYKEVGGFIAIGNIFPSEWNWQSFWALTALLSVILAIMNILPIPGLDGGHALFTLWEIITRRKPSDKFLEVMQYIGLALLLLLLVYANGNDIIKLFIK